MRIYILYAGGLIILFSIFLLLSLSHIEPTTIQKANITRLDSVSAIIFLLSFISAFIIYTKHIINNLKKERNKLSEEYLVKEAVDNFVNDMVIIFDGEGRITRINRACEYTMHIFPEEVKGQYGLDSFLDNEECVIFKDALNKIYKGETLKEGVNYWKTGRGTRKLIKWKLRPLIDEDGTITNVILTGYDVIERDRLTRDAFLETEEKYRTLVEQATDGIIIIQDDVLRLVNPAVCNSLGYTREQLLGRRFQDIIHPSERKRLTFFYKMLLAGENPPNTYESYGLTSDGKKLKVKIKVKMIQFRGKEAVLVIARDISHQRKTERALIESKKNFHTLMESSPVAVMILSKNKISYANPAAEILTGYCNDELKTISFMNFVHPDYKSIIKDYRKKLLRGLATPNELKFMILTRDGEERWVDGRMELITYEDELALLVILIDITERKEMKEAIKKGEAKYRKIVKDTFYKKPKELDKRIRKPNYIYIIFMMMSNTDKPVSEVLNDVVQILPNAWQYSEITCARIIFGDMSFTSSNFRETGWRQSADIEVLGKKVGEVEIYYLEERPLAYEGPFLKEERDLINTLARELGRFIRRRSVDKKFGYRKNMRFYKKAMELIRGIDNKPYIRYNRYL